MLFLILFALLRVLPPKNFSACLLTVLLMSTNLGSLNIIRDFGHSPLPSRDNFFHTRYQTLNNDIKRYNESLYALQSVPTRPKLNMVLH